MFSGSCLSYLKISLDRTAFAGFVAGGGEDELVDHVDGEVGPGLQLLEHVGGLVTEGGGLGMVEL